MRRAKHICYDRVLPQLTAAPMRTMIVGGRTRAIAIKKSAWKNGSHIKIRFLEGTEKQKDMVRDIAPIWTKFANLEFEFTDDPRAEIRVSFDESDGAWSYIGLDNKAIPTKSATLNLGWQDQGVILHEFGHMIGLGHEHQNPDGGIIWNEEEVIKDLAGPPNFWSEAETRHNVLNKYSADQINGTEFDEHSIMLYSFPAAWTKNTNGTKENSNLSLLDRDFIASEKMYPGRGAPMAANILLKESKWENAAVDAPGEEDVFEFDIADRSRVVIETEGNTDVVMVLLGPDSETTRCGFDDDSGRGRNARLKVDLLPGKYLVAIRHFDRKKTGAYRLRYYLKS